MTLDFERAALYPPAARSKVQRVAQSVRHIHGVQSLSLPIGGVVVVCLVKDGEYYVRAFIEHYLRIGAIHIVLLDNGSTDRTLDISAEYDRVTSVECRLPFGEHKLAMRQFIAEAYGHNHWCLSVDIDELWEFPFWDQMPLGSFVQYLEESGFTACVAHQLDLFGEGTITNAGGTDGSLADLRFFDLSDIFRWRGIPSGGDFCPDERLKRFFSGNIVSTPSLPVMARGVRWRLFGVTPILTKMSLFRVVQPIVPFVSTSHRLEGAVLADVSCVLRHMLLNHHLAAKAARCAQAENYYNNSAHYKRIADTLALAPVHLPVRRRLYQSVNDLVEMDFLCVSPEFAKFANSHGCLAGRQRVAREIRTTATTRHTTYE